MQIPRKSRELNNYVKKKGSTKIVKNNQKLKKGGRKKMRISKKRGIIKKERCDKA